MKFKLLRQIRRPFSNAHWILLLGLIGLWEFSLLALPCNEPPFYFEIALASFTLCSALWVSHLRALTLQGLSGLVIVLGGAIYDLFLLALLVVVIAMPITVVMPTYQCYTQRAKVNELVAYSSLARAEITNRIGQKKSVIGVGVGIHIELSGRVKGGIVTDDGIIIVSSDDPAAVVIFQPSFVDGVVNWKCSGFPVKYMPAQCR